MSARGGSAAERAREDGLRYVGATRREIEAAAGALEAGDGEAVVVMAGQVACYHPLVPAPEQGLGALVAREGALAISRRVFFGFDAERLAWPELVRANVRYSATRGVVVKVASASRRYVFSEPLRGVLSAAHASAVEALLGRKLGSEGAARAARERASRE